MNWKSMLEVFRAFRSGAPLGDVAVMKFAALRQMPAGLADRLGEVHGYAPELRFDALDPLPPGSLGQSYAQFLRCNDLQHLSISPKVLERFADNPYAVRYTVTHDLHHVLTGFDIGLAGEMGVVGFTVGQGTAPLGEIGMKAVRIFYPLLSPSQAAATRANFALGVRMGKAAELVLAQPLESWLREPLDVVRERLGIRSSDVRAVRPSGSSWLARFVFAQAGAPVMRLGDGGAVD